MPKRTSLAVKESPAKLAWSDFHFDILSPRQDFGLVIEPKQLDAPDPDALLDWISRNHQMLRNRVLINGGLYFKGFHLTSEHFTRLVKLIYPRSSKTDYQGGNVPREKVAEDLYLATTIPKEVILRHHSEMAYYPIANTPSQIAFFCETPSVSGGETPICSNRAFMKRLNPRILNQIREKGVMYLRNFKRKWDPGFGVGWERSYQTTDKSVVEEFCRKRGIQFTWKSNDVFSATNVAQGMAIHPETGEEVWYNQAYAMNRSSGVPGELDPCYLCSEGLILTQEKLEIMRRLSPQDLPMNTLYGDGSFIEANVLAEIHGIYTEEQVMFSWQQGDCMVLDNMLATHARNRYVGDSRKILVTWTTRD